MSQRFPSLALGSLLVLLTSGCGGDGTAKSTAKEFATCRDRSFTPPTAQGFSHLTSEVMVASGDTNHSAQDVVTVASRNATLAGKFSYGPLSTDLEDETVRVYLDECDGWHELGEATTDSDGRVYVAVPDQLGPGAYEARFVVLGDGTSTVAYLYVLPEDTRLTLTDIDGTLTGSDSELYQQMLDGSHVPESYPGAVALTSNHAQKGWVVFYLTGRPYWLLQHTRGWLSALGFAMGPIHVADSNEEALPTGTGVGAYKRAFVQQLLNLGYEIDFAYGNAATDVGAYLDSGIPAERIWIIGDQAGQQGTNAVAESWVTRAAEVETLDAVTQPF